MSMVFETSNFPPLARIHLVAAGLFLVYVVVVGSVKQTGGLASGKEKSLVHRCVVRDM